MSGVTFAQVTDRDQIEIEEITVTVERRTQSLQNLAGTAALFRGDDLKQLGVQNLTDLNGRFPGLQIANNQGNVEVWIRGIGSSNNTELGDPAAATHLDGVYVPRPRGIGSVFFDIERVEVNIGPQGTLRGRNATAGSVNIISIKPGLGVWDAMAEVEFGNFDQTSIHAMVNVPIGDKMALRVSGFSLDHDSYLNNVGPVDDIDVAEAEDNLGFRAHFLYEPNDKLRILLTGDYVQEQGTGFTGVNFANPLGNGVAPSEIKKPRNVIARGITPILDTEHWGAKIEINYDVGPFNIEYLGSYRDLVYDFEATTPLGPDFPGVLETLVPFEENFDNFSRFQSITDSESIIHELRLVSKDDQRLIWSAGVFYFEEEQFTFLGSTGDRGLFFSGLEFNQPDTDGESLSFFGDATFSITPKLRLTGGVRYTDDKKTRFGVNARYGFAIGGENFSCCGGVRIGTPGFDFAGKDRSIFNPDINGDGFVNDQEVLDFFFDGVKEFGVRDNVDDIFANGPVFGDTPFDQRPDCLDTIAGDFFNCPADGKVSFALPFPGQIAIQNGRIDNSFVDWRSRLEYDITDDHLIYFSVSTGHKSGGFNDNVPGTDGLGPLNPGGANNNQFDANTLAPEFGEEKVTLFEFGSKNEFDVGATNVRLNASFFYNDYSDLVLNSLLSVAQILEFEGVDPNAVDTETGGLVVSFNFNASDAEIYGAQFDGGFRFPYNINFDWSFLWLEANVQNSQPIQDFRFQADVAPDEAVNQSIDGRRLPRTPRYQLNGSLSHMFEMGPGTFDWIVSAGWRTKQFLTIFNSIDFQNPSDPRLRLDDTVGSFLTLDFGSGYSLSEGRVRVEAFVNNITNQEREQALLITQFDNTRFFTRPRTYGVRLRLKS
ncbi:MULTISPECIES: TonB-dependent receptor [unclassified Iodidimonas]|jgi:iron complex outermembrane receptor protein|uniref:TonB-dependent receptor n=1 Tax=unclassified Iodidimonas TaxID=2626145 RepID=UPI002482B571|nr:MULTISPECIES: TonB-dependent receptor [unclassified Iodidimonas]